ncbi:ABC transporter ATP-binding protein [Thermoflexus sp.]|uniref:ABC transporter ATP-binding protein n=1 Tax=Thermoflexus sp. TaxID=1969742 RepID=UPI0025F1412F|nr:ABC transporter ATP-binding protein [Thermoflexus sp.]MDW8180615.1 ABC transporter ATP-binding protein [Anaerolineae bacterium]MCS6964088.1 ABC transporter ATP-binding protein [Thermoflexus sp.]MCS7351161.1 ABC transporter ATP-binding protein [Thermoflexus sp.]MCX7690453.1 ABC transporter ATP-binding protein [Thermoflexus sp.]MDW8184812.1 ABC transporter ATP-binding protein [Anaerolineae bacterium]
MLELEIAHTWPGFQLQLHLTIGTELIVLFGRSGAGKSLTLRAVAGLFHPAFGRIVLNGRVLFDSRSGVNLPPQARRVGYVPQGYALFPHLTVFENVAYGLRGPSKEIHHQVMEWLDQVGLADLAGRRPHQLSGGQQQRVALARALAIQPDVLLLDEPLSALDAPTRSDLQTLIRKLQRQLNIPILFVTHNLAEAVLLADRIAVLEGGRLLQVGPPQEVLHRPARLEVAHLVGVRNLLRGQVRGMDPEGLRLSIGERELRARPNPEAPPLPVGTEILVCIRAEHIAIVRPDRPPPPERENLLEGEIVGEIDYGLAQVLFFRLHGPRLTPERDYDLEIEIPPYVYERLGLDRIRSWTIAIRPESIHWIPWGEGGEGPSAFGPAYPASPIKRDKLR